MTTKATPITELDFTEIKQDLKNFLSTQSNLTDYDYDGSTMAVLLDLLAYNTSRNAFYTNAAYNEMFLNSAQLRSSVVSHAKELNYLPRSYRSSKGRVTLTFSPSDNPAFITIPKYTKFTGTIDGTSYTFSTDQVYTITQEDNLYSISNVEVFEGRIQKEYFAPADTSRYIISSRQVDTNSINVRVYDTLDVLGSYKDYSYKPNIYDVSSTDYVFYLQPTEDEHYELIFGGDVFGVSPQSGQYIEVTYRISTGDAPNGINSFSLNNTIQGYTGTVTTDGIAEGGASEESVESIKFYAPKSIQIQERAVTESDYINLLKTNFNNIQAVSVYGGETVSPPQFGKVIVAVDVTEGEGVSENTKQTLASFLKTRTPLAIEPVIVSPDFVYVEVDTIVRFNTRESSLNTQAINASVRNAISQFSTTYLNDFNKSLYISQLMRAIDDTNPAIVGNDTTIKAIADFVPTLNSPSSFTFILDNPLYIGHPLAAGENISNHRPAIRSTTFTYEGSLSFIQDNGAGLLQVITTTLNDYTILNSNIGSVDYETGRVNIRRLEVSSYSGSAIKINMTQRYGDIIGTRNKIVAIRDVDVITDIQAVE